MNFEFNNVIEEKHAIFTSLKAYDIRRLYTKDHLTLVIINVEQCDISRYKFSTGRSSN